MKRPTLVLLPGMDGTGKLFGGLLKVVPSGWPRRVMSYPRDWVMSYGEVLELLENELRDEGKMVLVAESYSGPVALRFSAAHPEKIVAVVLCASFICSPAPRWLRWVVGRWMFWARAPKFVLRKLLVGRDATDALVNEVREAIATVRARVLARRVKDVLAVECGDALRMCKAPVMYLAGHEDALVGRGAVQTIQSIRPDVTVCEVDGPHLLLQSQAERAWGKIEMFLRDLEVL